MDTDPHTESCLIHASYVESRLCDGQPDTVADGGWMPRALGDIEIERIFATKPAFSHDPERLFVPAP